MSKKLSKEKTAIYMNNNIDNKLMTLLIYNDIYKTATKCGINNKQLEEKFIEYNSLIVKSNKKIELKNYILGFINCLNFEDDILLCCSLSYYKKEFDRIEEEMSWVNDINKLVLSYQEKEDLVIWIDDYFDILYENLSCIYNDDKTSFMLHELIDKLLFYLPNLVKDCRLNKNTIKEKLIGKISNILDEIVKKNKIDKNEIMDKEYKVLLSLFDEEELKIYMLLFPYFTSDFQEEFSNDINIVEISEKTNIPLLKCIFKYNSLTNKISKWYNYLINPNETKLNKEKKKVLKSKS